jgi:hypothetical protein
LQAFAHLSPQHIPAFSLLQLEQQPLPFPALMHAFPSPPQHFPFPLEQVAAIAFISCPWWAQQQSPSLAPVAFILSQHEHLLFSAGVVVDAFGVWLELEVCVQLTTVKARIIARILYFMMHLLIGSKYFKLALEAFRADASKSMRVSCALISDPKNCDTYRRKVAWFAIGEGMATSSCSFVQSRRLGIRRWVNASSSPRKSLLRSGISHRTAGTLAPAGQTRGRKSEGLHRRAHVRSWTAGMRSRSLNARISDHLHRQRYRNTPGADGNQNDRG